MLNFAFGEFGMRTGVYEWYKYFQEGYEDIEDDMHTTCPSTLITEETMEKMKEMVMNDCVK
jgi:hypothetical protein